MKYQDNKIISSLRAVKILFLSFTCEDIGVALVTNMISQLQESFPFLIEFSKFSRQTELLRTLWNRLNIFIFSLVYWLSLIVHTPDSFSCRHSLLRRWASSCVLCRNFISIYKINRTLHGRLGTRILSVVIIIISIVITIIIIIIIIIIIFYVRTYQWLVFLVWMDSLWREVLSHTWEILH